jgi:hypothetical protein
MGSIIVVIYSRRKNVYNQYIFAKNRAVFPSDVHFTCELVYSTVLQIKLIATNFLDRFF